MLRLLSDGEDELQHFTSKEGSTLIPEIVFHPDLHRNGFGGYLVAGQSGVEPDPGAQVVALVERRRNGEGVGGIEVDLPLLFPFNSQQVEVASGYQLDGVTVGSGDDKAYFLGIGFVQDSASGHNPKADEGKKGPGKAPRVGVKIFHSSLSFLDFAPLRGSVDPRVVLSHALDFTDCV
jgi:hypothetical protein